MRSSLRWTTAHLCPHLGHRIRGIDPHRILVRLLRRATKAGGDGQACPGLLVMAADAAYLQKVSQLLTSSSTPHLVVRGTPASPDLVRACLEQEDDLAPDLAWAAEDLLWVQGLADSFAWCSAHAEGAPATDARQVRLCAASDRIGHRPAAGISGTSACRDCKSEEDAVEPPADAGLAGALARMVQRLLALLPHTAGVTEQLVSAVLAACGRQMPCCAAESCWSTGGCEADTHVHNGRHSKSTCGAGQSWPEPMALWLWRSPAAQMPGGCSVQP